MISSLTPFVICTSVFFLCNNGHAMDIDDTDTPFWKNFNYSTPVDLGITYTYDRLPLKNGDKDLRQAKRSKPKTHEIGLAVILKGPREVINLPAKQIQK